MKDLKLLLLIISLLFLSVSCKTYTEDEKTDFSKQALKYAASKGYAMDQTDSGLLLKVEEAGTGETIQYTSEMTLEYVGRLTDGTLVDESKIGKPLKAKLNGLIAGFQEGLLGQKNGVRIHLVIPPQLGYGDTETGKIPANSILDFHIHVLSVN